MPTKTYECDGWFKFSEEDNYEHGCDPDTAFSFGDNQVFKGDTIEDVLKEIRSFVGVGEAHELELDACGEEGRVDIQVLETYEGRTADEEDIERWKRGDLKLWASTYSFEIYEVTRDPVRLRDDD